MKRKQVSVFVHVQRNSVWLLTHLQKKKKHDDWADLSIYFFP